jgi:short-subunit dehydrogenase
VLRHSESIDGVILMPERGVFGSIEETGNGEVRALFNRQIFNTSILMQAFLPVVRSNQRGSFIFVGRKFSPTYAGMTGWMRACNSAQAEVMRALKDEFAEMNVRVSLMETQLDAECFDAVDRILTDASGHSTYYRNMIEEHRRGLADTHKGTLGCQNFAIDVCNELPLLETDMRPPPPPFRTN